MIGKSAIISWTGSVLLLLGGAAASAQQPIRWSEMLNDIDIGAAVDSPYGAGLVDEIADKVHTSADAACLNTRRLSLPAIKIEVRNLLISYGFNVQRIRSEILNSDEFSAELKARVPNVSSEGWQKMLTDPLIIRRLAFYKPELVANHLDWVVMKIDQTSVIHRVLRAKIDTAFEGNSKLLAIVEARISDMLDALEAFDKAHPHPLSATFDEAWMELFRVESKASNKGMWGKLAPWDYTPNLREEMAKLCVGAQR